MRKTEGKIALTGQGKRSWSLELRIVCNEGQLPEVQVLSYEDLSSQPDIVERARQLIANSELTQIVTENVTSAYIGYKEQRSRRYKLIIAPRKNGKALAIAIPSNWDWEEPKTLRLTHTVTEKTKDGDRSVLETRMVWLFPTPKAPAEFQEIKNRHKVIIIPDEAQPGSYDITGVKTGSLDFKDIKVPANWDSFFQELESSSCCCVGRIEPKFPYLETYTIPEEFINNFFDICLSTLVNKKNSKT